MKQPAIALMLAALALPVVASQATAQRFTRDYSETERVMHFCWVAQSRIDRARIRYGNAYRSHLRRRDEDCAKARKMAKRDQEAGKPPFDGVPPINSVKPLLYTNPSYDWFFE